MLIMKLVKALFAQVDDQDGQVKEQVGQGQAQELDNIRGVARNLRQ